MDAVSITVLCSVGSLALGYVGATRTAKRQNTQDVSAQVKTMTELAVKMDMLLKKVDDFQREQADMKMTVDEINNRLIIQEEKSKTMWKRIDELREEKRGERYSE